MLTLELPASKNQGSMSGFAPERKRAQQTAKKAVRSKVYECDRGTYQEALGPQCLSEWLGVSSRIDRGNSMDHSKLNHLRTLLKEA